MVAEQGHSWVAQAVELAIEADTVAEAAVDMVLAAALHRDRSGMPAVEGMWAVVAVPVALVGAVVAGAEAGL